MIRTKIVWDFRLKVFLVVVSIAAILFLSFYLETGAQQPSGCSTSGDARWPHGTTVYFTIIGFDADQKKQIEDAFAAWTSANATNNSRVNFLPADASHPATYTVQAGNIFTGDGCTGNCGKFGLTNYVTAGNAITGSTTTLYLNERFSDGSPVYDSTVEDYSTAFFKAALHEIGHPMGLEEPNLILLNACNQQDGATVMNGFCGTNDRGDNLPSPTSLSQNGLPTCDRDNINSKYPTPTPTPCPCDNCECCGPDSLTACAPDPTPTPFTDEDADGYALEDEPPDCDDNDSLTFPGAPTYCEAMDRNCNLIDDRQEPDPLWCGSPVLIDLAGNGFDLTNSSNGVLFNLTGVGAMKWSWTAPQSDDAWLVLDRNYDGAINDGSELFGCITPQTRSITPNGFNALAEFDKFDNGGNNDGRIDVYDSIFPVLRLWHDSNHNGVADSGELKTLDSVGVSAIDLDYKESGRTDKHGNRFRYRAKIYSNSGAVTQRWAWDVFLNLQQ